MVFHLFLKLHWIHYDSHPPLGSSDLHPYEGVVRDGSVGSGIACGPAGNNCAVEGDGRRGPGLMPLPGKVRAKFGSVSRSSSRGSSGSLFDLSAARAALRTYSGSSTGGGGAGAFNGGGSAGSFNGGGSAGAFNGGGGAGAFNGGGGAGSFNGGGSAGALFPATHTTTSHRHGFGSSAYSASQTPVYSLSSVHIPHSSGSGGGASSSHSSLFGNTKNPKPTVDISAAWGRSAAAPAQESAAQFNSSASMLPQSSNSSFHMKISHGVVDAASVAVSGGGGSAAGAGAGQYSWNSAKLMDKDYNLLAKPKAVNVSDAWGQRVSNAQFSQASMLPQSAHSSFSLRVSHGVVDMSSTAAWSNSNNYSQSSSHSGASYLSMLPDNGGAAIGAGYIWRVGSLATAVRNSRDADTRSDYSWSPSAARTRHMGMGNWLIAPQASQWLPEGLGTA